MRAFTFVLPDDIADVSIAGLQWFILIPRLNHTGSKVIQLKQALIQEGNNIPQAEINTLIRSMRQRCQTVLYAEGRQ